MIITGKQVRAARMLVEWDAEELAKRAHVNRETVFNIERGTVQARSATLERIVHAFSDQGLEFLDNQGVRFRPEGTEILNGPEGLASFFDQLYAFLVMRGGLVCVSGVDEAMLMRFHGQEKAEAHIKRVNKLVAQREDIRFQVLLCEGDTNYVAKEYCHYRWQAKEDFVATPFYVFGDILALIAFQSAPAPKIIIVRSEVFATAYRKQFDIAWKIAAEPPSEFLSEPQTLQVQL